MRYMNSDRRDFFKQLGLVAASVAILPRIIGVAGAASTVNSIKTAGPYKIFYTFTAQSASDALEFSELIKTCGVRALNNGLKDEGHIISRSEFYALSDGSMRSEILFKSKESFQHFMESTKTVSTELLEFKKNKNIQIDIRTAV